MTELEEALQEAEVKAWASLAGYKFMMFGYWAAIWVHVNRIGNFNRPNPFHPLVEMASNMRGEIIKNFPHLTGRKKVPSCDSSGR